MMAVSAWRSAAAAARAAHEQAGIGVMELKGTLWISPARS
jgi:hypothetical protein